MAHIRNEPHHKESKFARNPTEAEENYEVLRTTPHHYAGRLGGNQGFVVDPTDPDAQPILRKHPDATPWISKHAIASLNGFKEPSLWKAAFMEGVGAMALCYLTIMYAANPALDAQPQPTSTGSAGVFGTEAFLGPLVGAVSGVPLISLLIFVFAPVTGGHLNPFITFTTFCCRLTTLPRFVLYVGFQIAGATLAGLLVRGSLDSTNWKAGGCFFDPNLVSVRQMFTIEFAGGLVLITLAFGVGSTLR